MPADLLSPEPEPPAGPQRCPTCGAQSFWAIGNIRKCARPECATVGRLTKTRLSMPPTRVCSTCRGQMVQVDSGDVVVFHCLSCEATEPA